MKEKLVRQTAERFDVVVIGAGQAGLATGYYLAQHNLRFVIVDANERAGGAWQNRWDSLMLFTPAIYNSLPGMRFLASSWYLPTTREMAGYLENYASHFNLPLRLGVKVDGVRREDKAYIVTAGKLQFETKSVIVATGVYQTPSMPAFMSELDPLVTQLHSSEYRSPAQLKEGNVLVVGAGNSGAQIAMELASSRPTWLCGPKTGYNPRKILGIDLYWWLYHVGFMTLRIDSWVFRLVHSSNKDGERLVGITSGDIVKAGVKRIPEKVREIKNGKPVLENGRVLDVDNVIWCTGFKHDFHWISLPVFRDDGYPIHSRGVVEGEPGLYFVGLPFLYRINSFSVGGVGTDAQYIVSVLSDRLQKKA